MIGRTLGHYRIVEKIGQGGMGVVYKARDTHLDRFVAIKVLPPESVADAERKARFILEAKAASALNHPNIITIYDISSADGAGTGPCQCLLHATHEATGRGTLSESLARRPLPGLCQPGCREPGHLPAAGRRPEPGQSDVGLPG